MKLLLPLLLLSVGVVFCHALDANTYEVWPLAAAGDYGYNVRALQLLISHKGYPVNFLLFLFFFSGGKCRLFRPLTFILSFFILSFFLLSFSFSSLIFVFTEYFSFLSSFFFFFFFFFFFCLTKIASTNGLFDSITEEALKEFQTASHLPTTGVADPETWAELTPSLMMGDHNKAVMALQHLLNKFSFALNEDGVFCVDTKNAVAGLQNDIGLYPDGLVGNSTWRALLNREHLGAMTVSEGQWFAKRKKRKEKKRKRKNN